MNEKPTLGFRILMMGLAVVIGLAGIFLFFQFYGVFQDIHRTYPQLGFMGWGILALWLAGAFVVMEVTTRLCRERRWSRFENQEGMAAGMLYVFVSLVVFLLVTEL